MQLAAAVTADGRQRPALVAGGQLRTPHFAQDGVDEFGAGVHQHFHRFIGAETFGELGVRFLQFLAKGVGCVCRLGEPIRQVREPQPGRAAQDRRFGCLDVLVQGGHLVRRRGALAALAERQHFDAGLGHEHGVFPLRRQRVVLGDHRPAVA